MAEILFFFVKENVNPYPEFSSYKLFPQKKQKTPQF